MIALVSEGAFDLRVHFAQMDLPEGGELYLYAPGSSREVTGPYGQTGPLGNGEFWSDIFLDDTVVVEYFVPAEVTATELPFGIDQVLHAYTDGIPEAGPREGDCHNDVTCYFPEWEDVANCTARIYYVDPPYGYFCTGSLLDTVIGDETPYFLTAGHCMTSDTVAATMVARWKWEATSCDSGTTGFGWKQSNNADLLYRNTNIDVSLCMVLGELKTNTTPYYWTGYSTSTVPFWTDLTCVSHPDGAYKRITFGYKIGNSGPYKHNISWTSGTIEGGSSGSGVWREDQGGQLYAGTASTSTLPIGCSNPDGPSQYGKFDMTYPNISGFLAGGSDDAQEDNDTCAAAVATSAGTYNNRVVKRLDEDWYRITVPACYTVDIDATFTDAHGNINIQLLDACGGSVVASGTTTSNNESVSYVNPGAAQDFFLRVYLQEDTRNTYGLSIALTASGSSTKGDGDCDGDIDLNDYSAMAGCIDGPDTDITPACSAFDWNEDNDVDLGDVADLQRDFTGG
jgi:hypothetical protein